MRETGNSYRSQWKVRILRGPGPSFSPLLQVVVRRGTRRLRTIPITFLLIFRSLAVTHFPSEPGDLRRHGGRRRLLSINFTEIYDKRGPQSLSRG